MTSLLDQALGLLDRLARLDPARQRLQQEIDRLIDGQPDDVREVFLGVLAQMEQLGLRVEPMEGDAYMIRRR